MKFLLVEKYKKEPDYLGEDTTQEVDSLDDTLTEKEMFEKVVDEFTHMSSNDLINLLNIPNKTNISTNSPMFLLPNGSIISVEEAGELNNIVLRDTVHSDMIYIIFTKVAEQLGFDYDELSALHDDIYYLKPLTIGKEWARLNCGETWTEERFYCVLPNHMTSSQYRGLEKWLEWGYDTNKKEVLILVGGYEDSHTYSFKDYLPEDIIKRIKRYYSSGRLYESTQSTILYRGKGNNNNPTNQYSGGRFYADNIDDASEYGDLIQVVELLPNAKIFKYNNSYDYCEDNGLLDKEYPMIQKLTNGRFTTLKDAWEELSWNGENPNLYYQISQYVISQELSKQGYDGVEWLDEDDLIPHQYQIWNDKVVNIIKNVDENGNELKESMNEEFVNELVPGELYHFIHNNKILYGTFKRKTPAWLFFDVEGEEVLAKPWTSVATTTEELEELIGLVDKMERDTKIPSKVPNRFTRVPNQHNKPMGESNELKQNYYPKLPVSLKEVERDGDNITYLIVDRNNQSLAEFTHYSNPRTNVGCIVHKVFNDNCGLWVGYETPYSPKDVLNTVHRFMSNDYFYESKSNELEQRAKKHRKKSKGLGWYPGANFNSDAGDVEKGIEVFNNSTSIGSGEGTAMGESIEKDTYYYNGPVYYNGHKITDHKEIYTSASSIYRAIRNVLFQAANGDNELWRYDIVDDMVKQLPKEETPKMRPKCQTCGYELNDIGDCPVCDYGEEDLLEELTDLEALWELSNLD